MTAWLRREGYQVNHKRVRRLMRRMGLEAVYPRRKRGLSMPDKEHKIYPYLLKDVQIIRPDQVWSADITYIRMYRGWLYLVAVMDWFSRYVLNILCLSLATGVEFRQARDIQHGPGQPVYLHRFYKDIAWRRYSNQHGR
jgi:transposase InsO family protein